jgi:hypothetical protein
MSVTRLLGLLACLVVLAAAAPSAWAQQGDTIAPPGNSAIDEYLETVPGADGSRPVDRRGANGLSPAQRRALERLGSDGKLAAEVLGASVTSDPAVRRRAREGRAADGKIPIDPPVTPGTAEPRSEVAAVADTVLTGQTTSGPSMGALLPLLLVGTVVFFAISLVLRRRA